MTYEPPIEPPEYSADETEYLRAKLSAMQERAEKAEQDYRDQYELRVKYQNENLNARFELENLRKLLNRKSIRESGGYSRAEIIACRARRVRKMKRRLEKQQTRALNAQDKADKENGIYWELRGMFEDAVAAEMKNNQTFLQKVPHERSQT